MKAALATNFPPCQVGPLLEELRRRGVEVDPVDTPERVSRMNLELLGLDVVFFMSEYASHRQYFSLKKTAEKAGVPLRSLSKNKAKWDFLPAPTPKTNPPKKVTPVKSTPLPMPTQLTSAPSLTQKPFANIQDAVAVRPQEDPPGVRRVVVSAAKQEATAPDLDGAIARMVLALEGHAAALNRQSEALDRFSASLAEAPVSARPRAPKGKTKSNAPSEMDLAENRILQVLTKAPNLTVAEAVVLSGSGFAGPPTKIDQKNAAWAMTKSFKAGRVIRTGTGGKVSPFRYSLPA